MEVIVISNTPGSTLKNEIMARHFIQKIMKGITKKNKVNLILFVLSVIAIATFIVALLLHNKGTFTVMASREDMIVYGLVLSDNPIFDRPRPELQSDAVNDMWNITQTDLPTTVDSIDGSHNGENYLAYTFYVKDIGDATVNYKAVLDITDLHLAVDDAMRVKIYLNGTPTVYAKPKSDGSGLPEPDTVPFSAKTRILSLDARDLEVDKFDKYTVVVWLEGEDPDCVNSIMGGSVKMTMTFTALVPSKKAS